MEIAVAAGVGRGPTELSALDAALAGAGVANYNLVTVSSVVPADAQVRVVDRVPDRGPAGHALTVVLAETTAPPTETVDPDATAAPVDPDATEPDLVAGLGWATGPGPGLFYEATGDDPGTVREQLRRGLAAGGELREWALPDRETHLAAGRRLPDAHVAAVTVAAYGTATPPDGTSPPGVDTV
jgi:arginine decarboxylase